MRKLADLLPKNMDAVERAKRVLIGGAVTSLVFVGPQTPVAVLGLYGILTGLFGRCPVYAWLDIDTRDEIDLAPLPVSSPRMSEDPAPHDETTAALPRAA